MVEGAGADAAGVVIGLDRKERGKTEQSAIQEVEQQFSIPVISIIDMNDILAYLNEQEGTMQLIAAIKTYRSTYGVT